MKVFALLVLVLGSVAARGSGPYLPSGWRPDGPAFYLPTKQTTNDNPLKDLILHGSEASGSDSLREYGPPKVSQEVIKQNLPNENVDIAFTLAEKLQEESLSGSEVSASDALREYGPPRVQESQEIVPNLPQEVTEQVFVVESSDASETPIAKAHESAAEPQVTEVTTIQAEVPLLIIQAETEAAVTSSVQNEDVTVTEAALPAEEIASSYVENNPVETEITNSDDANRVTSIDILQENIEAVNSLAAVEVELDQTVQQIVQNLEQTVEKISENIIENVEKIEEDGAKLEQNEQNAEEQFEIKKEQIEQVQKSEENEQKVVEQVVQNIPDVLTYVSNDIQEVLKTESQNKESYPEFSAALEQAPEGFLEYGPPGFKEYGPPKEDDLSKAAAEQLISEAESFETTNETRRRRFSPKFRPSKNH